MGRDPRRAAGPDPPVDRSGARRAERREHRQLDREGPEGEDRGYDGGKKISGRERHKAVDSVGLLRSVVVTAGSVDDARAAPAVIRQLDPATYRRMERLWADAEYHNHNLNDWLRNTYKRPYGKGNRSRG